MNYKDKIDELLAKATVDQIRAIAKKAMIAEMPKALAKGKIPTLTQAEDLRQAAHVIENHWHLMLNPVHTHDWRERLAFYSEERI